MFSSSRADDLKKAFILIEKVVILKVIVEKLTKLGDKLAKVDTDLGNLDESCC